MAHYEARLKRQKADGTRSSLPFHLVLVNDDGSENDVASYARLRNLLETFKTKHKPNGLELKVLTNGRKL